MILDFECSGCCVEVEQPTELHRTSSSGGADLVEILAEHNTDTCCVRTLQTAGGHDY